MSKQIHCKIIVSICIITFKVVYSFESFLTPTYLPNDLYYVGHRTYKTYQVNS